MTNFAIYFYPFSFRSFSNPNTVDENGGWSQINSFTPYWPPFEEQQQQYLSICEYRAEWPIIHGNSRTGFLGLNVVESPSIRPLIRLLKNSKIVLITQFEFKINYRVVSAPCF